MPYTYPASDFDNSNKLLTLLGSFWSRLYTAKDQVRSYAQATAEILAQTHLNVLETAAALSRFDIPVFHTENWLPIPIRKSQRNTTGTAPLRFDTSGAVFNGDYDFNSPNRTDTFAYKAPPNLANVYQIFDKLIFPTLTLSKNVDFVIDRDSQAIVFTTDPFTNATLLKRGIYDNGVLVDEEIILWGFKAQLDYKYVFNQFAYAVGLHLKSSENAKQFTNAVFNGFIDGGLSVQSFTDAVAAICDIEVVKEDTEVVELLTIDAHGLCIATDKHVYRYAADATPIVTVGQTVHAGDSLTTAIEVVEFNHGTVSDNLDALALDRGIVSACFYGDLVFDNKEVPLEVITDHPSGYTYVRFPITGFPADVDLFFEELHARGVAAAQFIQDPCKARNTKLGTLAHLLDKRAQPDTEPTAAHLPTTINPLVFLVKNVFRNNVFAVIIRVSELGKNSLGLYNIRHIRRILPPNVVAFFVYALDGIKDTKDGNTDLVETISSFTAMEPLVDDGLNLLVVDKGVTVRTISGTCH